MSDSLIRGLQRFHREAFPGYREHFRELVAAGQRPGTLFIGCSDSRVLPDLLTDSGPGDLFVSRNVGALVPPHDPEVGEHEAAAVIEYAVAVLGVRDVVVCGHSHCGAVRALYEPPGVSAPNLERWLELARPAVMPLADGQLDEDTLRETERRNVALQLERLADYPLVRERVEAGELALHGWHYILEEGRVDALDLESGRLHPEAAD
ncbi:MAG: carbonic anhydrase [Candidatus Palauibacterales bacterium]|nr:carbonic anhydrase [Candidatus Palauibacterales bacterium]MDP2530102.1 carbonic anhydrase [Candidatus Palauibacterales bacterium]MDP2582587.1 carbonic anhydrase [Candidatus Palauibacterales bacterium]